MDFNQLAEALRPLHMEEYQQARINALTERMEALEQALHDNLSMMTKIYNAGIEDTNHVLNCSVDYKEVLDTIKSTRQTLRND